MAINAYHHGEHTLSTERQCMLCPGLIRDRPAIAWLHPTPPSQRRRPPWHQHDPIPSHRLPTSSSALGALFVVAPSSRVAIYVVPPALTPLRPVDVAFQAKMVALARSTAGLRLPAIKPAYPR